MMFQYILIGISSVIFLIGVIYSIQYKIITKRKILVISMITTFFSCYSIFFLVSDYFTGNGVNDAVIYHLRYGLAGAGFREYWLLMLLTGSGIVASMLVPYLFINGIVNKMKSQKTKSGMYGLLFYSFILLSFLLHPTTYGFLNYFCLDTIAHNTPTKHFDEYFRSPNIRQISPKRNFVYLYLESLERTYFDESVFPGLIKELRHLESVSTSFTQIKQVSATGWTMAGMTASQCGIPLVPTFDGNSMSGMDTFLANATCLGDLLSQEGYKLYFLSGSSADFAGTGKFYATHGFHEVYGGDKLSKLLHNNAYQNYWGLYDDSLFDIAFNKFKSLSRKNEPFGLFLSTMDTHHPNGHQSISCNGMQYGDGKNPMLNAVACSDYLIGDFVSKILKSEYANNTVLVISSDHLAMRNAATDLLNSTNRNNLFMIREPHGKGLKVNKQGSMLDIGPTILPYLGYEGDMGLGRNLLENEEPLVSIISDFDAAIKAWGKQLLDFWGFPNLGMNDQLLISPRQKNVIINKRAFTFPLLIEFEKNNNTVIKFQFDITSKQFLFNHLRYISGEKPFLLVDRCETMHTLPIRTKGDYCIMFGRAGTKNIEYSVLQENIIIPVATIINPVSENHEVKRKLEIGENRYDIKRFIAHAGGEIEGNTYTNSLEALNLNYRKGFRLFELDILKTSDNVYVAAHDWKHWKNHTGFKGELPPTRSIFKQYKIMHKYTPLDIDDINNWFENHQDAILVTDKVNTPSDFSKIFIDKKRLMMELFTADAVIEGVQAKIKSAMPTWDILSGLKGDKVQALLDIGVTDIAASRRIIEENIPLIKRLKRNGINVYVFHVNADKGKNEKYVVCHDMDYIYGLYADKFEFNEKIDCGELDIPEK